MAEPILSVQNLTKWYDDYLAVDHISFDIHEGKILGLLGPNGAGKSTTIQMLLGLTEPDAGNILYFNKNFHQHKEYCLSHMNFASTYSELNGRMTVFQNLQIFAGLYAVPHAKERILELLQLFEIEECRDKLFWHLSSGQKTRAILAKSLLNHPKMLLMDEPTASLDPDIVMKIIKIIQELQRKESMTILYTSHNMDEVARLCDEVAFLAHGKIAVIDTPLGLTKRISDVSLTLSFEGDHTTIQSYFEEHHYSFAFPQKNLAEMTLPEDQVPKVLFGLKERGIWITSIGTEKPSLEDVFLQIAQQQKI